MTATPQIIVAGVPSLLDQYRLLWQSYLTQSDSDIQRKLIVTMMQVREATKVPDDDWDAFTTTLPGFDEWWDRVRGDYIDYLDRCIDQMD